MSRKPLQTGMVILCTLLMSNTVLAARGRPHIDNRLGCNILLSDKNTLLRGVSLSWDGGDPYGSRAKVMPSQEQLNALAETFGLNTLHVYLEADSAGENGNNEVIGYNAKDCDILVQRCADAGLYLIITIGCNGKNGQMNLDWSKEFWTFYGPRYKDETHVIYEAHNEPAPNTLWNWKTSDWDNQAALYKTIRGAAPDTFILLCSFMGFVGDDNIKSVYDPRNRADYLVANGVSWSNAGIAHHGYESRKGIETAISLLQTDTSYPALLCTEFWPGDTTGQQYNSMYESHFNGWMQFMWLGADDTELKKFKSDIEKAGTLWTPDVATCNWPAMGAPNIPAQGSSVGLFNRGKGRFIRVNSGKVLIADVPKYTGRQHDRFIIEEVGDQLISLKADNGLYVSAASGSGFLTAGSKTIGVKEQFIWYELPDGDVALRAYGGGGHLIRSVEDGRIQSDADNGLAASSNYAMVGGAKRAGPPPGNDE